MKKTLSRVTLNHARDRALFKLLNTSPRPGELADEHSTRCWWEAFCEAIEGEEEKERLNNWYKVKDSK